MTISVMKIPWDAKGIFKKRPNRFLGIVDITSPKKYEKKNVKVHVHDPGRLEELLYPKNKVLLRNASNPNRKTGWDLIAAKFEKDWILTHSGFHRHIAEWLIKNPRVSPFVKIKNVKAEVAFKNSRLDFLLTTKTNKKIWVEVKGCTLAEEGMALFPDAPTKRGARHIGHLIEAKKKKDESAMIILVFRPDATCFSPNWETDAEFAKIFYSAIDFGVSVHPFVFSYNGDYLQYVKKIPLCRELEKK
jgi:sugar fermentation stimulation protein A